MKMLLFPTFPHHILTLLTGRTCRCLLPLLDAEGFSPSWKQGRAWAIAQFQRALP